jgi:hypothetical protein
VALTAHDVLPVQRTSGNVHRRVSKVILLPNVVVPGPQRCVAAGLPHWAPQRSQFLLDGSQGGFLNLQPPNQTSCRASSQIRFATSLEHRNWNSYYEEGRPASGGGVIPCLGPCMAIGCLHPKHVEAPKPHTVLSQQHCWRMSNICYSNNKGYIIKGFIPDNPRPRLHANSSPSGSSRHIDTCTRNVKPMAEMIGGPATGQSARL